jgi:hypothetical protein
MVTVLFVVCESAIAQPHGYWEPLPVEGLQPGLDGWVQALATYDDGGGPAVYVAGGFRVGAGGATTAVAKWEGDRLVSLGVPGWAGGLCVADLGVGPALLMGGGDGVYVRHAGQQTKLSGQFNGAVTRIVATQLSGTPRVYAAGYFTQIDVMPARFVAVWNGSSWSPLDFPVPQGGSSPAALALFDDDHDGVPTLYAGGSFITLGGQAVRSIARYTGGAWRALPGPTLGAANGASTSVSTMCVGPDGLYVGGWFDGSTTLSSPGLIRWDGSAWRGLTASLPLGTQVSAVCWHDDGSGERLYAAGRDPSGAGPLGRGLGRLNPGGWVSAGVLGHDTWHLGPDALVSLADERGPALYVGGVFSTAGEVQTHGLTRLRPTGFEAAPAARAAAVTRVEVLDDDRGRSLNIAGDFVRIGGVEAKNIARWNGSGWEACGEGLSGPVTSIASADLGDGPQVFAGGAFERAGGIAASHVAGWDGAAWRPLGSGIDFMDSWYSGGVACMVGGAGPWGSRLFVGGRFGSAGGAALTANLASWDGQEWSSLGDVSEVWTLGLYNGTLCASGFYMGINGLPMAFAQWDGSDWRLFENFYNLPPERILGHDVGNGQRLYAAGPYAEIGGTLAQWDGSAWSAVGAAVSVHDIAAADAPDDHGLYAIGEIARGVLLSRWDGTAWTAMTHVEPDGGYGFAQMTYFDDGSGPALYAYFQPYHGRSPTRSPLSRFRLFPACYVNCDRSTQPPLLNVLDFNCFLNAFAGGLPYANCDQSTAPPMLNVLDFNCFLNAFTRGCP